MIYFDNAATSMLKPATVARAVAAAIDSFGVAGRGAHEASLAAGRTIYRAREQVADLFGASSPGQVAFTSNATEALNIAIGGLLGPGDHAITTAASHNSVLRPLYRRQDGGADLSILPVRSDGSIDYDAFVALFRPATRLVVVTHASNLTGDVYGIALMAEVSHAHGALLAVDAAQTGGLVPLDMEDEGIDLIAFTGHKGLFGPQGTGGLCLRKGLGLPALMVGGSGSHSHEREHPARMPERLEAGTPNGHGIAGLSAGLDYLTRTGIGTIAHRTLELTERFERGVRGIEGVRLYGGHGGSGRCGIVALNIGDTDSALVSDLLDRDHGICTRAGAHCAPLMHRALGTVDQGAVRFSFSHLNTDDEVDVGIAAVAAIAAERVVW